MNALAVTPIGTVRTRHHERADTPVQTAINTDDEGRVVLDAAYRDGLHELDGFDYVWLLTWLTPTEPGPVALQQVPFLLTAAARPIGLFAMRGPRRPNPIGLHLVRLGAVHDDGFEFRGVDMIDGTPLLDVKPWVAPLDLPFGQQLGAPVRNGWFDAVDLSARTRRPACGPSARRPTSRSALGVSPRSRPKRVTTTRAPMVSY